MKTENYKDKFDNFKKEYTSKRANIIAARLQFIENVVVTIMVEYVGIFEKYLDKNRGIINSLSDEINKRTKDRKDDYVLSLLNFIYAIPHLLILKDDDSEINYAFLKENFFIIKDENKVSKIYDSLNEVQRKVITNDAIKLYEYGNFILNFLNNFDFRKTMAIKLLNAISKSNDDPADIIINTVYNSIILKDNENKAEWCVPFYKFSNKRL